MAMEDGVGRPRDATTAGIGCLASLTSHILQRRRGPRTART